MSSEGVSLAALRGLFLVGGFPVFGLKQKNKINKQ
jgi:hypothetical protein